LPPEPDLSPPCFEASGAFAILAARSFDMPFFLRASYCFSFLTLARVPGIRPPSSLARDVSIRPRDQTPEGFVDLGWKVGQGHLVGRERTMDALKLLEDDHETVKGLLEDIEPTTERAVKTREQLFTRLRRELEVHETIEEEIFYPALKEHPKAKDLVLEAYEEHNVVDMVMGEIEDVAYDDETWGAKFTVLKENLEHHIEEEETEMWKQARQVFDDEELDELGDRMALRKDELMAD
jgi:hypothetical protein